MGTNLNRELDRPFRIVSYEIMCDSLFSLSIFDRPVFPRFLRARNAIVAEREEEGGRGARRTSWC